ncbi:hypothetical protein CPC08DRAFT_702015 [Agrocybe pediades]|nr:hypothetical protein CPC08DRAFT_702015 [Agrocybe pediades]
MAPKTASMALLFHPKKKNGKQQPGQAPSPRAGPSTPNSNSSQSQGSQTQTTNGQAPPRRRPPPKKVESEEEELKLPDGPFQEFKLLSSALNGWRYDVMKFESRRPVDIFQWVQPIKLNRKDIRKDGPATTTAPEAVGPMLGPDGKPVIGADGKIVMVDADGRPIQANGQANAGSKDKGKGGAANAKKRFQRKTRQVFFVPDEVRQLRREERYPWVMEDSNPTNGEYWTGQMEDISKAETHAFFMPAANDAFKFVPAHRWYKFQKRIEHNLPKDLAGVDSMYNDVKRDPQHFLSRFNKGKGVSAATAAMFKSEAAESSGSQVGQSLGPGGRKLKTVDSGMDHLFDDGEDDGEGMAKRRKRELGEEGDLDEQVYEEDFADDDEKMEVDDDDEEAKELEERLKKEYRAANKLREDGAVEDEEEEVPGTSKQAKAMQKLIRNREGNDAYDSDDDNKNPYASSEEEEEEEEVVATAASAIQQQQQEIESRSQTPKPAVQRPTVVPPPPGSRAASPTLSPSHGGHSIVAKRATSPKVPKPKGPNVSRGNSPLGGQSPLSRAASPVGGGLADSQKTGMKRKADDSPEKSSSGAHASNAANPNAPKLKKRKPVVAGPEVAVSSAELENLLLDWLRKTTNATTRDCIHHFTPYLTDAEKKQEFSAMVRKHAQLKNGALVLKRAGSSAPSPAANGA